MTDAETYAAGVLPKLSISLTNKGTKDCTIDVGSTTQSFTISSGADVWWRSTDCQENPSSMIATLTAGTTVTSKDPVTWDRTRSSVETCAQENRQRAPGGEPRTTWRSRSAGSRARRARRSCSTESCRIALR